MTIIRVQGMRCQHCATSVQRALEALGATKVQVDVAKGEACFEGTIEPETLRKAITAKGFELVG